MVARLAIPEEEESKVGLSEIAARCEQHGFPDIVRQFAHAAGDELPTTRATAVEGRMLLRNTELAHADVVGHGGPERDMASMPRARSWDDGAHLLMQLLAESSSLFRVRKAGPAG